MVARLHTEPDQTARFVEDGLLRAEIRDGLKNIGDMERTVNRVVQGVALPRDLVRLREGLGALPQLVSLLGSTPMAGCTVTLV